MTLPVVCNEIYSQNVEVRLVLYVNDEVLMHVVTHGMCIKI